MGLSRRRQRGELRRSALAVSDRAVPITRAGHDLADESARRQLAQHLASGKQPSSTEYSGKFGDRRREPTTARDRTMSAASSPGRATVRRPVAAWRSSIICSTSSSSPSIPQIIAAAPGVDSSNNVIGGSCLKGIYSNLTGDNSDPFPYFASLLAVAYPPDQVANIPGPNVDDPWPLGSLSFVGAKNTWGKDEINDIIGKGGTYPDGFLLALDGFSLNVLGATTPTLPDHRVPGCHDATRRRRCRTSSIRATIPTLPSRSCSPTMYCSPIRSAPFRRTGETPAAVEFRDHRARQGDSGDDRVLFHGRRGALFHQCRARSADPSELNVPWLSEDLRVFTATPGASLAAQTPVPGGAEFVENTLRRRLRHPGRLPISRRC